MQKPMEVTSKTKLELFSEHICAILRDQSGLNPELCGRIVARELVKLVISSACETVRMNGSSCFMSRGSLSDFSEFRDLKRESDVSAGDLENVGGSMKWREAKRDSTVSAMSLDSETFAGGEIATVVEECNEMEEESSPVTRKRKNGHKRVSVHVRPDIIVHIVDSEDDEIQIAAKKLVKKVLHSACKRLESLYRRSSIEYLTASTKRMRIADSPLPPQTLFEEDPPPISPPVPAKYSKVHPQTWPPNNLKQTHPELSVAACGTPSYTDLLSPSYLLSNCQEGSRNPVQSNPHLQTKRPRPKDSRSPSPSESLPGFKSPAFVEPPLSPPPLQREDSPTHSWGKLGKKRGRSESHDIMMLKELDKFRQSKLGQKLQQMTDKFSGILNTRRIVAKVQSSRDQLPPYPNGGGISVNSLASTMERMSIAEAQSESGTECDTTDEEYTVLSPITKRPPQLEEEVCTSEFDCTENARGFQSLPATLNGISVEAKGDDHFTSSCPEINSQVENGIHCHTPGQTAYENYHSVPEMDVFVIIHTYPPPGICQKFLCNNTNEVNLMYHCWLFPDLPFDPKVTRSEWLEVGVFQPYGVQPVHLDLQDAGVAFYFLDPRYCPLLPALFLSYIILPDIDMYSACQERIRTGG